MACRTEGSYISWYKRYVKFHDLKHPLDVGKQGVENFLNYLAGDLRVAAGTQNQAFSALLFLYREVLEFDLEGVNAVRAKPKKRLPVVLSRDEIRVVFEHAGSGLPSLMLRLLYGCGLRVSEGLEELEDGRWEVGKSGSREVGKSGSREVGESRSREVEKSGSLEVQNT